MLLNQQLVFLVWGGILVWLGALSFFLYRAVSHYRKLAEGVTKEDLGSILEKILKDQGVERKRIDEIIKQAEKLEKEGFSHIQKIGLVRFNPFAETGGDQSFTLAVLDGKNSGIVISSLHSRENTRIYAKPVKEGKASGYEFSKEESEAIKRAQKH